ncbi:MAG TPA: DUF692 domain-containing protein [Caulobacteraceae bacterium]|jgi:hypothetical protein
MKLTAGLGFKTAHLTEALTAQADGLWFEVHAENYMVDGGPRLAALMALREARPLSIHGVGLSIASASSPDCHHLARLARLVERTAPFAVSDHLAWQRWNGVHHADFLPFPRTRRALTRVIANVGRVQDALGRPILVENPSLYVDLPGHELTEVEFLTELAGASGCGLLLDVNNLFVSAHNLRLNAKAAIDAVPGQFVAEIHLAGHSLDRDSPLIIDTHAAPIADPVWALYARLIERIGPRPTLIERDDHIPAFDVLMAERDRAAQLLDARETIHA